MGYMRHHAIVITSGDWNEKLTKELRHFCLGLGAYASEIIHSETNGYYSFFIAPDGSKEGWDTSDVGDSTRDKIITWIESERYDDASSPFDYVEVQYGDEKGITKVCRDSDSLYRENRSE